MDLNKKYGPLPVWGWGTLGAGIAGLVIIMRRNAKAKAAAAAPPAGPNSTALAAGSGAGAFGTAPLVPTGNTSYYVDTIGSGSGALDTQSQAFQSTVQNTLSQHLQQLVDQAEALGRNQQYAFDEPQLVDKYKVNDQIAAYGQNVGNLRQQIGQDITQLSFPQLYSQQQNAALRSGSPVPAS